MTKILEVKNVSKALSKKKVLKDVSFSVSEGEIYGFL
jgi:ABC-2 type transport system ATP-binding protein